MLELKKYRGVMSDGIKIDPKFEGKLTGTFQNDMGNLANLNRLK